MSVDQAIAAAIGQLGTPYVFGAEQPGQAFDCSGLTQYAYAAAGVKLPRTAAAQQAATQRVSNPLPGDLVFYGDPAYHVAIYIGAGRMIAAPDWGQTVKIQDVWGNPTYGRVPGIGTALGPLLGVAGAATGVAGDVAGRLLGPILGGARNIAVEGAFVAAGVALVGFGLWRAVAPRIKEAL